MNEKETRLVEIINYTRNKQAGLIMAKLSERLKQSKRSRFHSVGTGGAPSAAAAATTMNNVDASADDNVSDAAAAKAAASNTPDRPDEYSSPPRSSYKKIALAKAHKQLASPTTEKAASPSLTHHQQAAIDSMLSYHGLISIPTSTTPTEEPPRKDAMQHATTTTTSSAILSILEKRRRAASRTRVIKPRETNNGNEAANASPSMNVKTTATAPTPAIETTTPALSTPERASTPSRLLALARSRSGKLAAVDHSIKTPPRHAASSTTRSASPPVRPRLPEQSSSSPAPNVPLNSSSNRTPPLKPKYAPLPEQDLDHEKLPKIEVVLGDKHLSNSINNNMHVEMRRRYGGAAQLSAQFAPRSFVSSDDSQQQQEGAARPSSPLRMQLLQRLAEPRSPSPPSKPLRANHGHESPGRAKSPDEQHVVNDNDHLLQTSPPPDLTPPLQDRIHRPSPGQQPVLDPKAAVSAGRYKFKHLAAAAGRASLSTKHNLSMPELIQQPILDEENGTKMSATAAANGRASKWTSDNAPQAASSSSAEPQGGSTLAASNEERPRSPVHSRKWYLERHAEAELQSQAAVAAGTATQQDEASNNVLGDETRFKTESDIELKRSTSGCQTPHVESTINESFSAKRWGVNLKQVGSIETSASSETERELAMHKQQVNGLQVEPSSSWKSTSSKSERYPLQKETLSGIGSDEFPDSITLELDRLPVRETPNASNKHNVQAGASSQHAPPEGSIAKAKWMIQRSLDINSQSASSIRFGDEQKHIVPAKAMDASSQHSTKHHGSTWRGRSSSFTSHSQGAGISTQRSSSAGRSSQVSSGYGRTSPLPRQTNLKSTPSWVKQRSGSPSQSNSLSDAATEGNRVAHSAAATRMRSQSSPRLRSESLENPIGPTQQAEHRADDELPERVSVSSMIGRFAMPTASSKAKRSPRRPQAHKSFFQNDSESPSEIDDDQNEAMASTSRAVIETPDRVSVADMKDMFGKNETKPTFPKGRTLHQNMSYGSERNSPVPHSNLSSVASQERHSPIPHSKLSSVASQDSTDRVSVPGNPPRYRQSTTAAAGANATPASKIQSSYRSPSPVPSTWKRGTKSEPPKKEAMIPSWVLRYKGDERVVESGPRQQVLPVEQTAVSDSQDEQNLDQSVRGTHLHGSESASDLVVKNQLQRKEHNHTSFASRRPSVSSTIKAPVSKISVEQSFEIVSTVPFDELDPLTSSPVEPISPRALATEKPWVEDAETMSPRSRQLREKILEGQQTRAKEAKSGQKSTDLTSRLALIRDKLREHEDSSLNFEEEKKCEEITPRFKLQNSLSASNFDKSNTFKKSGSCAEDQEALLSVEIAGKTLEERNHQPLFANASSQSNQRQQFRRRLGQKGIACDDENQSSAIFGEPDSFSTVPVSQRARAIANWQGGLGVKHSKSETGISHQDGDGHPLIEIVDTSSSEMQHRGTLSTEHAAADNGVEIAAAFIPSEARFQQDNFKLPSDTMNNSAVLRFWSSTAQPETVAWKDQDPEPVMENSTAFDGSFLSDITGLPCHTSPQSKKPIALDFSDPFFDQSDAPDPFSQEAVAAFNKQGTISKGAFDPFSINEFNEDGSFGADGNLFVKAKLAPKVCGSPAITTFSVPNFDPDNSLTVKPVRTLPAVDYVPSDGQVGVKDSDIVWNFDAPSAGSEDGSLSRGFEI
ncbi:hypothetical protein MPSEU_000190600 [Mayamaea pseudoterrestris]|nr:hypothetical protein MPSEU_000190600 [Mayamaea pseudoterrestris]